MTKINSSSVYINIEKKKRAEDVYLLVTGKKNPKTPGEEYNKDRFIELAKEASVDLKDHDTAVAFIYETMGGAILTQAEVVAKKTAVKKTKAAAKADKDEEEGTQADEDDADDDDDE